MRQQNLIIEKNNQMCKKVLENVQFTIFVTFSKSKLHFKKKPF